MRVVLIGARGKAGSRILAELLRRGHPVTVIARNADNLFAQPGVATKRGGASQLETLAPLLAGYGAVKRAACPAFWRSTAPAAS